jgi:hypothetical protein
MSYILLVIFCISKILEIFHFVALQLKTPAGFTPLLKGTDIEMSSAEVDDVNEDLFIEDSQLVRAMEKEMGKEIADKEKEEGKTEDKEKVKELHDRKIQTCQCLIPTFSSKHGSTYLQLGYGSTRDILKKKISLQTHVNMKDIFFAEIEFIGTEKNQYHCNPVTEVLNTKGYKLVVLFKKNQLFQCERHCFIVVALVVNGVIDDKYGQYLRKYFVHDIIPHCPHQLRSSCTFNKSLPEKCSCQGTDKVSEGFSLTFGCTRTSFSGGKCRFSKKLQKKPAGRFPLKGLTTEELKKFEEHVVKAANEITAVLQQYAPKAFANLTENEPNSCRLGNSAYTSMSIVSDFTAHQHLDSKDVRNGATTILTLLKNKYEENGAQYHCLPAYRFKGAGQARASFKLEDRSALIEVASMEVHCSTPISNPNGLNPTRLGLVFFSHSGLHLNSHGFR